MCKAAAEALPAGTVPAGAIEVPNAKVGLKDMPAEPAPLEPTPLEPAGPDTATGYLARLNAAKSDADYSSLHSDLAKGALTDPAAVSALGPFQQRFATHSQNYTGDQWRAHNQALIGSPVNAVPAVTYSKAKAEADTINKATPTDSDAKGATGWKDWLTENWQTLLVPAGLVAAAFGGNVGKAIGVLAMAAGGYNIYERYSRLTDPKNKFNAPISAAIQSAAKQVDAEGTASPFHDLDLAAKQAAEQFGDPSMAPAIKASLSDYTFLASHGFSNYIASRVNEMPRRYIESMHGPDMATQVAGAEPPPGPGLAQTAWDQTRSQAGNVADQVSRALAPGGGGW